MSKIIYCDKCKKKQSTKKEDGWVSLTLSSRGFEKIPEINSGYLSWDLCPKCGEIVIKKILK